jgi:hypothetical protein
VKTTLLLPLRCPQLAACFTDLLVELEERLAQVRTFLQRQSNFG